MDMPSAFNLTVRLDNVAVITIDVPDEKMNTLKAEFGVQVRAMLKQIRENKAIRGLVFISAISRFGGFRAAIACMTIETLGLTLLWLAPSTGVALIGAGLTGFGLSLVYPALGVEAIKQVPNSSRGAGLSAYAVFFDLALAIAGPLMGAVALNLGYGWIFFCAALLSVSALGVTVLLKRRAY